MKISLPTYKEIPDVGLYLDQVTKYLNKYLLENNCNEVTPSMISNYVKLKIVSKANRKMYSREQIAQFIFVSFSKSILTMDQIRVFLELQKDKSSFEEAYETFYKEMTSEHLKNLQGITDEKHLMSYIVNGVRQKITINQYFSSKEL